MTGGAPKSAAKKESNARLIKRSSHTNPTKQIKVSENKPVYVRRGNSTRQNTSYYASHRQAAKRAHRKPMRASFKTTRSQGTNNQRRSQSNKTTIHETSRPYYKRDRTWDKEVPKRKERLTDATTERSPLGLNVDEYVNKIYT